MPDTAPIGIVLFNLGGPETLAEVEPFLVRLFSDREIIELPVGPRLQPLLARIIARARGPSVRRNYGLIGGGSPQLALTRAQATALERRLNATADRRGGFRVAIAMRYSRPGADEALEELAAAGARRIVALTLFPHWSKATTGSSWAEFQRALASERWRRHGFDVTHIDRYAEDPCYLDACAGMVRQALDGLPPRLRGGAVLLFSAHGMPQTFIDQGDPYVTETLATVRGVLARLNVPNRHVVGYQSRTGPVRWIGPGTDQLIERLGREGVDAVLVVPVSFVSDHIETLYEVDILFRDLARAAGIAEFRRAAALNSHRVFIEALAGLVERHVGAAATAPAVTGAQG